MADQYVVAPKPPPQLNIPESKNTVKVSCIDTTSRFKLPMDPFLQPSYTDKSKMSGPSFSFLIEHPKHKPILFDLGIRKDWWILPSYAKWVDLRWQIHVDKDVAEILNENGWDVAGGAIESIILSHHHWDHVGDAGTFPGSTEVVVGPGFVKEHLPGYPENKGSTLMAKDYEGREVREIDFSSSSSDGKKPAFKIGRFGAYDYFGDGSFYLLDTPGHSVGHICGLARTSSKPDSFVFMGGDAAHHGGEFRPTEYLPLPKHLTPSPIPRLRPGSCPGELLTEIHPHKRGDKPFYYVTSNFAHDKEVADWTIDGLGEFDAHESVLMLMAHDDAVVDPAALDFFPAQLNGWLEKGVAKKVKWRFLMDFQEAVCEMENGGEAYRWGKYP